MNIKNPINSKVVVAFPDMPVKPVAKPRPAVNAPLKGGFKSLFRRLVKTKK